MNCKYRKTDLLASTGIQDAIFVDKIIYERYEIMRMKPFIYNCSCYETKENCCCRNSACVHCRHYYPS